MDDRAFVLEAKDLYKSYGKKEVIKGLSFKLRQGEIIGLLGPNGAGKTSTFYMLVGAEKVTKGHILLNGEDISSLPMYKRARLGIYYLPQENSVFRKMTVENNILAVLEIANYPKANRQERIEELLHFFHIKHIRKSFGYNLSGGEKRRVEIARAIACNPKILLLDEPFAGIDPITIIEIQHIINNLVTSLGVSVIITDHNVREALKITNYAYIIVSGKVFAEGSPDVLTQSKDVQEIYLGKDFTL